MYRQLLTDRHLLEDRQLLDAQTGMRGQLLADLPYVRGEWMQVALAMEKLLTAETRSKELEVQLESLTAQFGDLQIEIRRLEVDQ